MTQPNYIALDSVAHKSYCVIPDDRFSHSAAFNAVALGFNEIASIAGCMPILVAPDLLGAPEKLIAVVGWPETGNVFCGRNHWKAHAVPLSIQCTPFNYGLENERLTVLVDEASERFVASTQNHSQPLFSGDGTPSQFLKQVQSQLSNLALGQQQAQMMIQALSDLDMFIPLSLTRTFADGKQDTTSDLLTIDEEKLVNLNADTIYELHKNGLLMAINAMILSLRQYNRLVQLTQGSDNPISRITLKTQRG